jgi:hypothetical protein
MMVSKILWQDYGTMSSTTSYRKSTLVEPDMYTIQAAKDKSENKISTEPSDAFECT